MTEIRIYMYIMGDKRQNKTTKLQFLTWLLSALSSLPVQGFEEEDANLEPKKTKKEIYRQLYPQKKKKEKEKEILVS